MKARPVSAAILCDHTKKFWYSAVKKVDVSEVQLHTSMIHGSNMEIRLDEISKINVEHVYTIPDEGILTLVKSVKNFDCTA